MQRPADPSRLSPVPYEPKPELPGNPLKLWLLALILILITPIYWERRAELPFTAGSLFLLMLWDYWHGRRRRPPESASTIPDRPIPPRSAERHGVVLNLRNYLALPLHLLAAGWLLWLAWAYLTLPWRVGLPAVLTALAVAAWLLYIGWQQRLWRWRRYGYVVEQDYFYVAAVIYLGPARELARWPAADFIGIYWERGAGGAVSSNAELWLAGPAGGQDVRLAALNYWHLDNHRQAQRLTAKLSKASGLPQLYRWPSAPNLNKD